jgi:2-dehydropantoate 2-reductase
MSVAEAAGITLEPFDECDPAWYREGVKGNRAAIEKAMRAISEFHRMRTKAKTAIWRDLTVRKRETEVNAQLGVVIEKGTRRPCRRRSWSG